MTLLEDDSLAVEDQFRLFGDKSSFALELCLASEQPDRSVPEDSVGSWGGWRLWVGDVNFCRLQLDTADGPVEVQEVRWFLAPLIRWLVGSWTPLLHEAHLPPESGWGDRRPRWARLAYLAMMELSGDSERFRKWQDWAGRHALRSAAEGGLVPDIFFQRVGDELELSWGDRLQPGGESATFLLEDGRARVPVDGVGEALSAAIDWFLEQPSVARAPWSGEVRETWRSIAEGQSDLEPLHWYLDSQPKAGPLSNKLFAGLDVLGKARPVIEGAWLGILAPEIAMFGDLTPQISQEAAVTLLTEFYNAKTQDREPENLSELVHDDPAWTSASPFEAGYALALDVLDEADPDPDAPRTELEDLLHGLSICVRNVELGEQGPRGVALAGSGLRPTILVNLDHPMNRGLGRRFTEAHELCHILFDRQRARPLAHSSTPWAAPSVEQRANAFAAMLLMPTTRAKRPTATTLASLSRGVSILADKLGVSRIALRRHLANLGEINDYERDHMLGARDGWAGEERSGARWGFG
ncbi:MAG: ImmA/IrrE family metallo-endopeptidase [Sphingomonas pseudosanguinis]|uniref:ImmA/IrrE family metallo-endopeptidase n=1 Tax=Sphingomonas pseudosanguinis TaxID=413712 RepID=UPI003919567C